MKRESFFRHFSAHWISYLLLAGACLLIGITAFQLTEPRSNEPRTLLIDAGGNIPGTAHHASVEYPSADSKPEIVQAYVLTTGGGDFDYFIAPIAIRQELTDQQLIRPFPATGEFALPLNDEYALYLAHSADEEAAVSPPEF